LTELQARLTSLSPQPIPSKRSSYSRQLAIINETRTAPSPVVYLSQQTTAEMGKKKRGHPDVEELVARPWCYYCQCPDLFTSYQKPSDT